MWREDSDPLPEFRFMIPVSTTPGFQPRLLDSFTIRFFNDSLTTEILSIPIPLPATGNIVVFQPTAAQWATIKAGGGMKKWFVGGKLNATDTDFYWSSAFSFYVLL